MAKIPTFTQQEYSELAASIEDGSYFEHARRWYSVMYMSIMPERCLYLVFTSIAAVAGLMSLISLLQLTPLAPAKPIIFPMQDVVRDVPLITALRSASDQPVDEALQQFFITTYLNKREGYRFEDIQAYSRFLNQHSNEAVVRQYRRFMQPSSPRSPINLYERHAQRDITIADMRIRRADGRKDVWEKGVYLADVSFTATVHPKVGEATHSYWRAEIEFDYSPIELTQPDESQTNRLQVSPMAFRVTDYTVIEILPDQRR